MPSGNGVSDRTCGPTTSSTAARPDARRAPTIAKIANVLRRGTPVNDRIAITSIATASRLATPARAKPIVSNVGSTGTFMQAPSPPVLQPVPPSGPTVISLVLSSAPLNDGWPLHHAVAITDAASVPAAVSASTAPAMRDAMERDYHAARASRAAPADDAVRNSPRTSERRTPVTTA